MGLRELDQHVNVDAGRVGTHLPDVVDDPAALRLRLHGRAREPDLRTDVRQPDVWGQWPLPKDLIGALYVADGHHHPFMVADVAGISNHSGRRARLTSTWRAVMPTAYVNGRDCGRTLEALADLERIMVQRPVRVLWPDDEKILLIVEACYAAMTDPAVADLAGRIATAGRRHGVGVALQGGVSS